MFADQAKTVARRNLLTLALFSACALMAVTSGGAITGGQFDSAHHPYVGLVDNGSAQCSGTLLSPTVLLTAAHCFPGSPVVRVSFDPNLINTPRDQRVWFYGSYYSDPQFQLGAAGGLLGTSTHDVAMVVFATPIPSPATSGQYGALPSLNAVSGLSAGAAIDIVGFGVQSFTRGGGQPRIGDVFTRYAGLTTLITSNNRISDSFIRLHANDGGVCFGDSGGPDLLAGTNTILAVNSFDSNDLCSGVTYSYRVDTADALGWIRSTAAAHGGSL